MNIKAKIMGWEHPILSQVSRIREGMINNNVELTDNEPDFLYKNEDFFEEAIDFANRRNKKPYCIFNILDLQLNNKNYNLDKLMSQLLFADKITCISDTVKKEIWENLGLEAINIGNPVKDITYNPEIKKDIDFTIIGRNSDLNKRGFLFQELLGLKENQGKSFMVVGPESLPFSKIGWIGIINDNQLSEIYNRSKFVLCCSKREGLNLIVGESCMGGAIPLIASDMSTCKEWNMPEFVVEPNIESINDKVQQINKDYLEYQQISLNYGKIWQKKFNKSQIAQNIINIYLKNS